MKSALLIFVDGVGLGELDPRINPLYSGACPVLERILKDSAVPIDASLGLPGLPQSATGTTAILTGVNAAQVMGRHVEGFPGERLKTIIREHNIFARLSALGFKSTFANAYFVDEIIEVERHRHQSVTTVAALGAFGRVRDKSMLLRNEAVYQDLTRESLRPRDYTGPLVTPDEAASHLLRIVRQHDFTLFEYFQTDRAGHDRDPVRVGHVLSLLDAFLGALLKQLDTGRELILVTSDHGNIEDLRSAGHTSNPVPFVAVGPGADTLRKRVKSIVDITPALLEWIAGAPGENRG